MHSAKRLRNAKLTTLTCLICVKHTRSR